MILAEKIWESTQRKKCNRALHNRVHGTKNCARPKDHWGDCSPWWNPEDWLEPIEELIEGGK